jgi:hypothetical protein
VTGRGVLLVVFVEDELDELQTRVVEIDGVEARLVIAVGSPT